MNCVAKSNATIIMAVLATLVMAVCVTRVHAEPCYAGEWHKTRLYGHSFNSGDFTDEKYDWIRDNFEYFTIEKTHLRSVYGNPSHELTSRLTATRLINANPRCKPIMIYSMGGSYPHLFESEAEALREHPDYFLYDDNGDPSSLNLSNPGENDWYIDTVNWNCDNSDLYGIFVDGFKGCWLSHQSNVRYMLDGMTGFSLINGLDFTPDGLTIRDGLDAVECADGLFMDSFFRRRCVGPDSGALLIDTCLQVPNDKMMVCFSAYDGLSTTPEFSHAAYLIVAHDQTYYRWVGSGHLWDDTSLMTWHEDFGKEIGRPLAEATKDGYAYHRVFRHCTVDVNVETQTSSIAWGQENMENLAPSGAATQSSTNGDSGSGRGGGTISGAADRAIDGETHGLWSENSVTRTATEAQPWWQVDLGASYLLDEIRIWNRSDCCTERLSDYDVFVLDSSGDTVWSDYQADSPDPQVSLNPHGAVGRYVMVQLRGVGPLSLAEVQVFGLPSAVTSADVGEVAASGSAFESRGTYSIHGSGAGIQDTADAFHYVYHPSVGDSEILAHVVSVEDTNDLAQAGVMIRESLDADSVFAVVSQGPNNQVTFQWRSATGAPVVTSGPPVGGTDSMSYVRVVRRGNEFSGYYSSDSDAGPWTQIDSTQTIPTGSNAYAGLAVTSHDDQTLCTAVMDSVMVIDDSKTAQAEWTFDHVSSTTVYDSSGHGHDAARSGGTLIAGNTGTALNFNGTSDSVSLPAQAFANITDQVILYDGALSATEVSDLYRRY